VFSRKFTPWRGEKDRHEHRLVRPTGVISLKPAIHFKNNKPESRKAREPEMQGDTGAPMPISGFADARGTRRHQGEGPGFRGAHLGITAASGPNPETLVSR
jgi:hypothetical protein